VHFDLHFFSSDTRTVSAPSACRCLSFISRLLPSLEGFIVWAVCRTKIKLKHLRQKWGGEWVHKVKPPWPRITNSYNFLGRKKKSLPLQLYIYFWFNMPALTLITNLKEELYQRHHEHRLSTLKNSLNNCSTSLKMSFGLKSWGLCRLDLQMANSTSFKVYKMSKGK